MSASLPLTLSQSFYALSNRCMLSYPRWGGGGGRGVASDASARKASILPSHFSIKIQFFMLNCFQKTDLKFEWKKQKSACWDVQTFWFRKYKKNSHTIIMPFAYCSDCYFLYGRRDTQWSPLFRAQLHSVFRSSGPPTPPPSHPHSQSSCLMHNHASVRLLDTQPNFSQMQSEKMTKFFWES
jgi:hypothetical protein